MAFPEAFVLVVCGMFVILVLLLTVITQLDATSCLLTWQTVGLWVRRRIGRGRGAREDPGPRQPGRRARRSQRRKEGHTGPRVSVPRGQEKAELGSHPGPAQDGRPRHRGQIAPRVKESEGSKRTDEHTTPGLLVDSVFGLYERHLSEEKRRVCVQLQNVRLQTLTFPCSGCGKVNAKKNCSYNCCAQCCRDNKNSVCRVHGTGYQAALAQVDAAIFHEFIEFDLSYAHLKHCPPKVPLLGSQLTSLNLSNNRLTDLPEDIGNLCSLQELFLQYNCLTRLPVSVCSLSQLLELDVKNNRLTDLPEGLGNLEELMFLSLTNNHIGRLPKSIGNLLYLQELSLHSNHLTELPDEICNLINLKIMYCGENRLQRLPAQFGDLVSLEELDVSCCELVTLPRSITHCQSLVRLWLSNNRLVTLPSHIGDLRQLKELHVRNNHLKYFPSSIKQLQLYTFTAQNNRLVDEHIAKSLCREPTGPLPPLLELAARAVLRLDIRWSPGDIPRHLADLLQDPSLCSRCGAPFFTYFSSQLTFETVGVFYRVPLYQQFCSPHLNHCPDHS